MAELAGKITQNALAAILHCLDIERGAAAPEQRSTAMFTILFIILILALVGGGLGHSRYGYAGWSPAGVLVVVLLLLMFTGHRI
jgi:hypothetical protein